MTKFVTIRYATQNKIKQRTKHKKTGNKHKKKPKEPAENVNNNY